MMDYKVDYHIHTIYSDGALRPVEIIKKRKAEDYDIIAITDHDGIDGLPEALTAGEALEIKVIPGVELSTVTDDGVKIHLLGYDFDIENQPLIDQLAKMKEARKERNGRLLTALQNMGYDITMDDLDVRNGQTYYGKPHFANALVKKGYAKDKKEVFDVIFERPEISSIAKEKINIKDGIKLINDAGGMAVIAHPGKIKNFGTEKDEQWEEKMSMLIRELKIAGLKGIECFHPDHGKRDEDFFIKMANQYHLHMTQGSDFHEE